MDLLLALLLQIVGFTSVTNQIQAQTVTGVVYLDENRNGAMDEHEPGIPGVIVSNQQEVVLTDDQGKYRLSARSSMIIFITKPSGYTLPLNENYQPQFYYIHQPQGSPDFKYLGVEATGNLPASIDFALYKSQPEEHFEAIIVGDPQPRDSIEVGYFRDDIVSEILGREASFYMAYGDIVFDNLSLYPHYNQIVSKLGLPAYNVHGNHDMNYDAPHDSLAAETFKRYFGPPDYSFDYGKVHFIVLDNVDYQGWDEDGQKNGSYQGRLNDRQLQWLKQDLAFVPDDYLVVLNTHIPIKTPNSDAGSVNLVNRDQLFEILKERTSLLALSAHMHYIDHMKFEAEDGWEQEVPFYNINVGAACGAWWSGPKDTRGIPESYSLDGSPNGFYIFNFSGNQFNYQYVPANMPEDRQLRVSFPIGLVNRDSLKNKKILVNVFNADVEARVFCTIDDGQPQQMQQEIMPDPFIIQYLQDPDHFPDWANRAVVHKHMWSLPLPEELSYGNHRLRIEVTDSKNNTYRGFSIFTIQ